MPASHVVTLGAHEFPVVAQPHSRLRRGITSLIADLPQVVASFEGLTDATDVAELVAEAGEEVAYKALAVFIPAYPKRVPFFEFLGYASQEAHDMDEYDGDTAADPTVPEIVAALTSGIKANDLESLGKLLGKASSLQSGI